MSNFIKKSNEINKKEFDIGQVVYFVSDCTYVHQSIDWGIVEEYYSDGYGLSMYEPFDNRVIDGIPIADYNFNQKRKKLPKNWTYNTTLFELSYSNMRDKLGDLTEEKFSKKEFYNPDFIKHCIDVGYYVKPSSQNSKTRVEADITKDGWTVVNKVNNWPIGINQRSKSDYCTVATHKLYSTYEEAQKEIDDYLAEFYRQANLSDYDWSVEQIDHDLDRWCCIYKATEKECKDIRDFLLKQKNVEDIETRIISAGFQWKYTKNKKWMTIEV